MAYLAVAVVLIGVLSLVNLALTFAVIRRMRVRGEHPTQEFTDPGVRLLPGADVPDFSLTTTSGETRSLSDLTGAPSVIAFFSAGCHPCTRQLPEFVRFAQTFPGGQAQVLAVVNGAADGLAEYLDAMEGAASVATEDLGRPISAQLSVKGYPTFYTLDETGRVEASGSVLSVVTSKSSNHLVRG